MAIVSHSAHQIGDALVEQSRQQGVGAQARVLKADNRGAEVSDSSGSRSLSLAAVNPGI
jgi:hypothetical protein